MPNPEDDLPLPGPVWTMISLFLGLRFHHPVACRLDLLHLVAMTGRFVTHGRPPAFLSHCQAVGLDLLNWMSPGWGNFSTGATQISTQMK